MAVRIGYKCIQGESPRPERHEIGPADVISRENHLVVDAEEQRECAMLSFIHVKFGINLFAELPTFNKLLFIAGMIDIAEEVPRTPVENAQGYVLNLPAQ